MKSYWLHSISLTIIYFWIYIPNTFATDFIWDEGVTGEWTVPNNWTINSNYPGTASNDLGRINNGNTTIGAGNMIDLSSGGYVIVGNNSNSMGNLSVTGAIFDTANLYIGWNGTGNVLLSSGNFDISNIFSLGTGSTGTGYMIQTGGNITSSTINIGDVGTGYYEITNAKLTSSNHVNLGVSSGGGGNLVVNSGANITITGSKNLYVSRTSGGTGNMTMNGGTISLNSFYIGNGDRGILNLNGGTITGTSSFIVGDNGGSNGNIIMSGGNLTTSGSMSIPSNGTGNMHQTGGNVTLADLRIGSNGAGRYIHSGGNLSGQILLGYAGEGYYDLSTEYIPASSTYVGYLSGGIGNLTINSGGNINAGSKNLYIGNNSGSYGYVNQNDGFMTLDRLYIGKQGSGTYNMTGGNLQVTTLMTLCDNSSASANLFISGGLFKSNPTAYFGTHGNAQIYQSGGNLLAVGAAIFGGYSAAETNYTMDGGYFSSSTVDLGFATAASNGNITVNGGTFKTGAITIATVGSGRLEVSGDNFTATNIDLKSGNATFRVVGPSANVQCTRYKNDSNTGSFECILSTNSGHFTAITCSSVIDMHGHLKVGLDGGILMASSNTFDLMRGEGDQGNTYASTPAMWDVNLITNAYGTQEALRASLATGNLQASLDLSATGNASISSEAAGYVTLANIDTTELIRGLAVLLDVQSGTTSTVVQKMISAGYSAEAFSKGSYDIRVVLRTSDLSSGTGYFAWDFTDVSNGTPYSYLDNIKFEIPQPGTIFRFE